MKKYIAELTGTFALVFCGTGAIVIDQQTNGQVGHIGIAITFGLIVTAMIYTFGGKSGAHINRLLPLRFHWQTFFQKKKYFLISYRKSAVLLLHPLF